MKDFLIILNTYKGYIGLLFGIGSIVFAFGVKSATKEITSKSSDVRIERWAKASEIYNKGLIWPQIVKDYHANGKLVFSTFMNIPSYYDNKCYLWGSAGFLT